MNLKFTKKFHRNTLLVTLLLVLGYCNVLAQCDPTSVAPVAFSSVSTTDESCPQSGTITVNGASGGGGVYMYEIFDGPILRAIQSQNVFPALKGGTYKIRITGCNGKFKEVQATIANKYLRFSPQYALFIPDSSFKCGNTTNGMIVIKQEVSTSEDTTKLKGPLRYQISTNSDPYTGFNGVPYNNFSYKLYAVNSRSLLYTNTDTVRTLSPGLTYYIRVTDACGVFITTNIAIPAVITNPYTFSFQLKNPYDVFNNTSSLINVVKGGCPQWGELSILNGGVPVTSIAGSNIPITVRVRRQDDNSIVQTRIYRNGNLGKFEQPLADAVYNTSAFNSNLLFDSLPRVPL